MFRVFTTILLVASLAGCTSSCVHVPEDVAANTQEQVEKVKDKVPTNKERLSSACDSMKDWIDVSAQKAMDATPGFLMKNDFKHCAAYVDGEYVVGTYYVDTYIYSAEGGVLLEGAFVFKETNASYATAYMVFKETPVEVPGNVQQNLNAVPEDSKVLEL